MRTRTLARAALLFGAALLASCDGASSPGEPTPTVGYRYGGVTSGKFSLTAPRPASDLQNRSYVEGFFPGDGTFWVSAQRVGGDGRIDLLLIDGPRAPGSYALGNCGGVGRCTSVAGALDATRPDGTTPEGGYQFYFTGGTLTILEPSREGWVRGRFSGKAFASVYTAGAWRPAGEMTIRDGSFEADLLPQPGT